MKQLVVACSIMENEIEKIIRENNLEDTFDLSYQEDSLHNSPERLTSRLQEVIDANTNDYTHLMFAFANCGNGLVGLESKNSTLIIPRYEDCISMFMRNVEDLIRERTHTYYLTQGWLNGTLSLEKEYAHALERYGQEKTDEIMEMLYEHYHTLTLIDTQAYDIEAELPRVHAIAERLDMEPQVVKGDLSVLERLLTGQWDADDIVVKAPGTQTVLQDFFAI